MSRDAAIRLDPHARILRAVPGRARSPRRCSLSAAVRRGAVRTENVAPAELRGRLRSRSRRARCSVSRVRLSRTCWVQPSAPPTS